MVETYVNKNLKYLREQLGVTREVLGSALDFKRGLIASYEHETKPSLPKLDAWLTIASHFAKGNEEINISSMATKDYESEELKLDVEAVNKSLGIIEGHKSRTITKLDSLLSQLASRLNSNEQKVSINMDRETAQKLYNVATQGQKYLEQQSKKEDSAAQ